MNVSRVAYVVSTFPKLSETFIIGELAELRRRGIEPRVFSLKQPEETVYHEAVRDADLLARTSYDEREFRGLLDAFKPQVVHAHFATEPTATARRLACEYNVPFTFTAHGYDVYRKPPADFADRAAAAASLITVSEANRRHIADTFHIAAGRIAVIPCGVDTEWFSPGTPDDGPPWIVCVARLREVKRLDVLMHACATLRDRGLSFRCAIVGEGPERAALEALRRQLRLDDIVHMPGAAEHAEVRCWWRRGTIAVLSSRSEGMPVSLMEAAACGLPAVAPAVGGIPELIEPGVTGLVTAPGDGHDLASALARLLVNDALRAHMRAATRRRAIERFSRTTQIDRLVAIWTSILN